MDARSDSRGTFTRKVSFEALGPLHVLSSKLELSATPCPKQTVLEACELKDGFSVTCLIPISIQIYLDRLRYACTEA